MTDEQQADRGEREAWLREMRARVRERTVFDREDLDFLLSCVREDDYKSAVRIMGSYFALRGRVELYEEALKEIINVASVEPEDTVTLRIARNALECSE